jgi:hypothetical protein
MLSDLFTQAGITALLAGGYAVNAHKFSRQTDDIDFVLRADDASRIDAGMARQGYSVLVKNPVFVRYASQAPFERIIDFLFVDGSTYEKMTAESQAIAIAGRQFRVLSLKHLIAMKLHALKFGDRRRQAKDILDIIELARLNSVDVASDEFKAWCLKYGNSDIFERICSLTGKRGA